MAHTILVAFLAAGYVLVLGAYIVGATVWVKRYARYRRGGGDKPDGVSPVSAETLRYYLAGACGGLVGAMLSGEPAAAGVLAFTWLPAGYAMSFARFLSGWRSPWAKAIAYALLLGFGALDAFLSVPLR